MKYFLILVIWETLFLEEFSYISRATHCNIQGKQPHIADSKYEPDCLDQPKFSLLFFLSKGIIDIHQTPLELGVMI